MLGDTGADRTLVEQQDQGTSERHTMPAYIRNVIASKITEDKGASAVEYGLLVAAIAAVIILLVFALGGYVKGAFDTTCKAFESKATTTTGSSC